MWQHIHFLKTMLIKGAHYSNWFQRRHQRAHKTSYIINYSKVFRFTSHSQGDSFLPTQILWLVYKFTFSCRMYINSKQSELKYIRIKPISYWKFILYWNKYVSTNLILRAPILRGSVSSGPKPWRYFWVSSKSKRGDFDLFTVLL